MAWVTVAGIAVSAYGAYSSGQAKKKELKQQQAGIAAQDPYGPYRADAAKRLQDLQNNPDSIKDTAEYKARQTAASRLMASQGYTGSGNALGAAAEAGGQSYQQAMDNLMVLSGAGQPPGSGYANANQAQIATNQNYANNMGSALGGVATGVSALFNRPASGQTAAPAGGGTAYSSYYGNAGGTGNTYTDPFGSTQASTGGGW